MDAGQRQPLCRKRLQHQNMPFIEALLAGLHRAGSKTCFPFFAHTTALSLTQSQVPAAQQYLYLQSPTTSSLETMVQLQRHPRIWKMTELALPYPVGWPQAPE